MPSVFSYKGGGGLARLPGPIGTNADLGPYDTASIHLFPLKA